MTERLTVVGPPDYWLPVSLDLTLCYSYGCSPAREGLRPLSRPGDGRGVRGRGIALPRTVRMRCLNGASVSVSLSLWNDVCGWHEAPVVVTSYSPLSKEEEEEEAEAKDHSVRRPD